MKFRKIVNDPVYGFITFDDELIYKVLSHPWYQRLRRIHQMALAHLVYPGAVHTRLHHSMGAYHLMCQALSELRGKGIEITADEEQGAKLAILLHDIGHGPFSHALEHVLIEDVHHEEISVLIFEHLNKEFNGALSTALSIFKGAYPKLFLHQLISSQLDVDRMDYLTRDSFYSGVNEGVIGYDRIIKMMTVHNNEIVIEEKGVYSIEKFLVARRLMYWQAYLHKTVLSAENMLVKILERAKILARADTSSFCTNPILDEFIRTTDSAGFIRQNLNKFCSIDDYDVLSSIKLWSLHSDKILSALSTMLINRNMLKTRLQMQPIDSTEKETLQVKAAEWLGVSVKDASFLVFDGLAENRMYNTRNERINILFKDGTVKDISEVEYGLIHLAGSSPAQKFYLCAPGEILKKPVAKS
ncbi:MAG: HD domain-containing protein [Chitinophagaceae bacterium]|nr:HD domain-containing protein [Chitinophagaceae bacterium]